MKMTAPAKFSKGAASLLNFIQTPEFQGDHSTFVLSLGLSLAHDHARNNRLNREIRSSPSALTLAR
jgi:hypothetical protein